MWLPVKLHGVFLLEDQLWLNQMPVGMAAAKSTASGHGCKWQAEWSFASGRNGIFHPSVLLA